jgi:hypothetical protein
VADSDFENPPGEFVGATSDLPTFDEHAHVFVVESTREIINVPCLIAEADA